MTEWFVDEPVLNPIYYWFDMKPDGTHVARPVQYIDGRMVFLDRP